MFAVIGYREGSKQNICLHWPLFYIRERLLPKATESKNILGVLVWLGELSLTLFKPRIETAIGTQTKLFDGARIQD